MTEVQTNDLDRLRTSAAATIRAAFSWAQVPTPDEMRNEHCDECRDTVAIFAGKPWQALGVSDLKGNPAPSLLTPVGFRYYLPAMMLLSLEAPEELDLFPDSVISILAPPVGQSDEFHADRVTGFTDHQVGAIVEFLGFFEARERAEWALASMPPTDLIEMPTHKVVRRALDYWTSAGPAQPRKGRAAERGDAPDRARR